MKTKLLSVILSILFFRLSAVSQEVALNDSRAQAGVTDSGYCYKLKNKVEIPIVVAGAAFTAYNFSRISKKTASDNSFVEALTKKDVNWFDRWGVRPYSKNTDNASYIPFYISMPLPLIVIAIDRKMRKDFYKLTFLYVEAITTTGILYSSAAGYVNRLRPLVYSAETPLDKRTVSDSKKSFFAGHVALVATSTFFIARILADYYPDSRYKWLYYGVAGIMTAGTGYMRQAAGEHFLSDIMLGAAVGTLSALLIPSLHQHKLIRSQRLRIFPSGLHGAGLTAFYRL